MQKAKLERRDTLRVISDLLQNMKEPVRVTHLLYSSNLSYKRLKTYLKIVKDMGLVQEQILPFHTYVITEEGKKFFEIVNKRNIINKLIS